jgi:hypothetical protein
MGRLCFMPSCEGQRGRGCQSNGRMLSYEDTAHAAHADHAAHAALPAVLPAPPAPAPQSDRRRRRHNKAGPATSPSPTSSSPFFSRGWGTIVAAVGAGAVLGVGLMVLSRRARAEKAEGAKDKRRVRWADEEEEQDAEAAEEAAERERLRRADEMQELVDGAAALTREAAAAEAEARRV